MSRGGVAIAAHSGRPSQFSSEGAASTASAQESGVASTSSGAVADAAPSVATTGFDEMSPTGSCIAAATSSDVATRCDSSLNSCGLNQREQI